MSVGYIPLQNQFISPYSDHRFSNTIGRYVRSIVGDVKNCILPYSSDNFTLEIDSTNATLVNITSGIACMSDTLIHVKSDSVLDFSDPLNYVGDYKIFGPSILENVITSPPPSYPNRYFILGYFNYQRTIPQPSFSFVICKQRSQFLANMDSYLYLGSADVTSGMSGPYISQILYEDTNEFDGDAAITRNLYQYRPPIVDGGEVDSTSAPDITVGGIIADLTIV